MGNPKVAQGQGMPKCGAKTRGGKPCTQRAGHGTDHLGTGRCKFHGGCTPTQVKGAQRQMAEAAVVSYGLPRQIDPHAALLEELHRTAGHVAWLGLQVQELEHARLYGPVGGSQFGIPKQEPHVWIRLYQEERAHFVRIAKTCVEVGIAERQVRLAEDQAQRIVTILRGVLDELGVSDRPEVPDVVRRHLTLVAAA